MKFCVKTQKSMAIEVTWQNLQIKKKIKKSRLPASWKLFHRHIWTKSYPILMKCGTVLQMWYPMTVTWQNINIFKIYYGGRPQYWKSFSAVTQPPISRFQWNLARSRSSFFAECRQWNIQPRCFLVFLMQFQLRRARAFHIVSARLVLSRVTLRCRIRRRRR